jgi:hypothetical protein
MTRTALLCLMVVFASSPLARDAFGWGAVRGPYGGAAYRGPMGGTAVRGPYGAGAYRGPYGGAAVRGPYGGTAYRAPTAVYRGGTYYGGTTVVTPGVGVAAGVAVGAAAGAAAASSAYAAPSYNYYPPPYYYPPGSNPGVAQQPAQAAPTQGQVAAIRQACRADYQAHCASVPTGGSAALACLQQNAQSLSAPCQQALGAVGGATP